MLPKYFQIFASLSNNEVGSAPRHVRKKREKEGRGKHELQVRYSTVAEAPELD